MKCYFNRIIFFVINFILILFLSNVYAMDEQSATDHLLMRIHQVQSYQADFTQTLVDQALNRKTVSYGTLWVKQPNYFKWEITSPNKQLLISNGKTLWNYDLDLEQVTVQKVPQNISEAPILLLLRGNPKTLDDLFNIKEIKKGEFSLKPKSKDQVAIKEIKLYFDKKNLQKLTIYTSTGQTTYILFKDYKTTNLDSSFFNFKAPKGVDVLGGA